MSKIFLSCYPEIVQQFFLLTNWYVFTQAMQHHYLSEIRRASAPITKPLGSVEIPLSDFHFSFTDVCRVSQRSSQRTNSCDSVQMLHAQLDMELDKNRQNGISSGEGEQPDAFGMWA